MDESLSIDGVDLEGKYVILREDAMAEAYRDITWRVFRASGGFGCGPNALGSAVFGEYIRDGEECRRERYHIERLATADEAQAAWDLRNGTDLQENEAGTDWA